MSREKATVDKERKDSVNRKKKEELSRLTEKERTNSSRRRAKKLCLKFIIS